MVTTFMIAFALYLSLFSCQSEIKPDSGTNKPNIIIIMADDLGYGDMGCYGNKTINTPNIDSLAARGIKFTDFHSNGPVCSPTRAALLTGKYQQRTGIEGVITARNHRHCGLDTGEVTIADYLKKFNYTTGIIGKWHLGYDTAFSPLNNGFDLFRGYVSGNIDYHSHIDQTGMYDWWSQKDTIIENGYSTDLITRNSVDFINNNKHRPFFLYIAHEAPHFPYQGRKDPPERTVNGIFDNRGSRSDKESAYKEMIEAMDEGIGQIIEVLIRNGILENTIIFFISDNGALEIGSNSPLRNFKGTLWEGGHRVPAILYWKSHLKPKETDQLILSMDIFPTVASLAGIPVNDSAGIDGLDISAILMNEQSAERTVFWRFQNCRAVRNGKWKLLTEKENHYLFDLSEDISENNNLIRNYSGIADSLLLLLGAWEKEMNQYNLQTK